jgi:hypothetical protein
MKYRLGVWLLMDHLLNNDRVNPRGVFITSAKTECSRGEWRFSAEAHRPAPAVQEQP